MEVGEGLLVLITYDVSTIDTAGRKRLRRVAKECQNYGQRVQNSVFECVVDAGQFLMLKNKVLNEIDIEKDSVRFYLLGNHYKTKVEHHGIKENYNVEGVLLV